MVRIRKPVSPALHLGKSIHAALQAFHLARWRGGDDSPAATAAAYDKAFRELERDEGPVKFDDEAGREKNRLDGLRVVAAYLDSPEAMTAKPRAVEVRLLEDIPGLSGVGETHAFCGEAVEVWGLEFGVLAIALRLAVPHVVEEDEDGIGVLSRRSGSVQRGGNEESEKENPSGYWQMIYALRTGKLRGGLFQS